MSFIADEIDRQLESQGTNAMRVAEVSNISASQIYKWTNNEQTSISREQIDALARAISSDINDHARLVRAHLLDEKFGPGSELVRVELDTPAELKDQPRPRAKGEKAMEFLAQERMTSRAVNDLVIDLAKCLGAEI